MVFLNKETNLTYSIDDCLVDLVARLSSDENYEVVKETPKVAPKVAPSEPKTTAKKSTKK